MEPPVTNWPPKRLTPSIWGLESRPFRELPTPFLWAMTSLDLDLRDADRRHGLAVAAVATIVLPPLELHDRHFPPATLRHDLAADARVAQPVGRHDHLAVARDQEHRAELHRRA